MDIKKDMVEMKVKINENWTYKELVDNIEALKTQINGVLASFSCYEIKLSIQYRKQLRKDIYALKFEEWKKERILEYIYDDIGKDVLYKIK